MHDSSNQRRKKHASAEIFFFGSGNEQFLPSSAAVLNGMNTWLVIFTVRRAAVRGLQVSLARMFSFVFCSRAWLVILDECLSFAFETSGRPRNMTVLFEN